MESVEELAGTLGRRRAERAAAGAPTAAEGGRMGARLRLSLPAGLAAALLLAGGCGDASDVAACRRSCEALGLASGGQPCETMCTGDCAELAETYGVEVATCERLQAGEL